MNVTAIFAALGALVVASPAFFIYGRRAGRAAELRRQAEAKATAEDVAKRVVADAEREAENLRKSAIVSGKEELIKLRETFELEARGRREEVEREERRLEERETQLDRKVDALDQRDKDVSRRLSDFGRREKAVTDREAELEKLVGEERRRLEQLAGMSAQDAKGELIRRMEEEAQADAANRIREIRESARRNAEREAKKIVALAIQRIAADHTAESTVSAVSLPNDEMKGRIIGREGRNIRAFELATGRGRDHRRHAGHGGRLVLRSRSGARWRAWRSRSWWPTAASIRGGSRKWSTSRASEVETQIVEIGRAGGVRGGRARAAPGADQARGAHEVAHQLRAEHPPAFQGSGLAGRHHGRRARPRRGDGQARRAAARHRQGAHARARGHARAARRGGGHEVRRESARGELHRGPPRRRAARERGVGARAGGRRDLRIAARARAARRSRRT